jgi:hypothetical protein
MGFRYMHKLSVTPIDVVIVVHLPVPEGHGLLASHQ